jgi:hypothetical protein
MIEVVKVSELGKDGTRIRNHRIDSSALAARLLAENASLFVLPPLLAAAEAKKFDGTWAAKGPWK